VAGVCSMGADGVEFFQLAGARVGNAVGGHRARGLPTKIVGLIDCIEQLAVWVQGKEGRAWCFSGQPETGEHAGFIVKAAGIDPLALTVCVGAKKDCAFHCFSKGKESRFCKREAMGVLSRMGGLL